MISELFANVENFVSQAHNLGGHEIDGILPFGMVIAGLLIGLRHSFEADHVVAVSVMLSKNNNNRVRGASLLGAFWGLGHTVILLAAGTVVLFLLKEIPSAISGTFEFIVGIMLVFLGITAVTSFNISRFLGPLFSKKRHSHPHFHKELGIIHNHEHDHTEDHSHHQDATHTGHRHGHKSFLIGMIHGLAGSGALMVIIASNMDSPLLGIMYILLFGAGSITGMMAASTALGIPFSKMKNNQVLQKVLRFATAAFSIALGIGLMYHLAFVDKIFSF